MGKMININGDLFLVKRITNLNYEKAASLWNEYSPNHKTFKRENQMFFCELIEEAEIIETNNNKIEQT